MRFAFNEEQTMLRDMLAVALEREAGTDRLRQWCDEGDFTVFDRLVQSNGWAGIGVDDAAGGQGGGLIEQAILFEALGYHSAPSGRLLAQMAGLMLAARARIARDVLTNLAKEECVLACDMRRPVDSLSGHDIRVECGALHGRIVSAQAPQADQGLLLVVPQSDGAGLWKVDCSAVGVIVTPLSLVDRASRLAALTLEGVQARRVGELKATALSDVHARLAVLLAAESLGLARRMIEMTVKYVAQRVQFGVPIGSFQAVKHEAAQMLVDIEAANSGVYYAAWALDEGVAVGAGANERTDALRHAWIAKAFATEAAARTADRALMLHGAIGYTFEYELQFFFKRAKLNVELLGSPRLHRERLAASLPLIPANDTPA